MSPETRALVLVMAKMALADGQIAEQERGVLEAMLDGQESVDAMLSIAEKRTFAQLIADVPEYADRFFIALRAACLARIDDVLEAKEEQAFESLIRGLGITVEDRALILEGARTAGDPSVAANPRIEELVQSSSFA